MASYGCGGFDAHKQLLLAGSHTKLQDDVWIECTYCVPNPTVLSIPVIDPTLSTALETTLRAQLACSLMYRACTMSIFCCWLLLRCPGSAPATAYRAPVFIAIARKHGYSYCTCRYKKLSAGETRRGVQAQRLGFTRSSTCLPRQAPAHTQHIRTKCTYIVRICTE